MKKLTIILLITTVLMIADVVTAQVLPVANQNDLAQNLERKVLTHEGPTDANGCHRDPNGIWHCH